MNRADHHHRRGHCNSNRAGRASKHHDYPPASSGRLIRNDEGAEIAQHQAVYTACVVHGIVESLTHGTRHNPGHPGGQRSPRRMSQQVCVAHGCPGANKRMGRPVSVRHLLSSSFFRSCRQSSSSTRGPRKGVRSRLGKHMDSRRRATDLVREGAVEACLCARRRSQANRQRNQRPGCAVEAIEPTTGIDQLGKLRITDAGALADGADAARLFLEVPDEFRGRRLPS
jgi:hypothetical protein